MKTHGYLCSLGTGTNHFRSQNKSLVSLCLLNHWFAFGPIPVKPFVCSRQTITASLAHFLTEYFVLWTSSHVVLTVSVIVVWLSLYCKQHCGYAIDFIFVKKKLASTCRLFVYVKIWSVLILDPTVSLQLGLIWRSFLNPQSIISFGKLIACCQVPCSNEFSLMS